MRTYRRLGEVPRKRHMRFEVDGKPIFEELFGREGFSGPSSLLYHRNMPESAHNISAGPADLMSPEREQVHEHAHLQGFNLQPDGDVVSGRKWVLINDDIQIGLAFPVRQQEVLSVNGSADEILFVHRGAGVLHTQFGRLPFGRHDYVVIPRGTIYRVEFESLEDVRILALEVAGLVDSPDRYRARNGQLTEIAPYSERDFRGPEELEAGADGPVEVWLKRAGRVSRYRLDHHPFDVVGWDGTVYPVAFNIHDFEPRAGRFHVPPPIHQTFQAHNVVICSFVPRKLDWDPEAVMLPYHHSNLDSDEVLYYVDGDYAARRGVKQSSFTHHVGGVPHGPQPGALEASYERPRETNELAVMVDTFRPLHRTEVARQLVDREYPYSWHIGGMRGSESIA
ncbi:MAG TPA: homogentisate 1,2-dioxygenase [Candidatus Dormibacteraeota bacterium]